MRHVFKPKGAWKDQDDFEYTVKAINEQDHLKYLQDGWFNSLGDAKAIQHEPVKPALEEPKADDQEEMSDYERGLRDKIKALGGSVGGRAKIETIEAKLAELKAAETEAE